MISSRIDILVKVLLFMQCCCILQLLAFQKESYSILISAGALLSQKLTLPDSRDSGSSANYLVMSLFCKSTNKPQP